MMLPARTSVDHETMEALADDVFAGIVRADTDSALVTIERSALEAAASLAAAACISTTDLRPLSPALAARIEADAMAWFATNLPARSETSRTVTAQPAAVQTETPRGEERAATLRLPIQSSEPNGARSGVMRLGWLVAAAAVILAAVAWIPPARPNAAERLSRLVAQGGDVAQYAWSAWDNPEIDGVQGDVFWSESRQEGYMVFKGLPSNPRDREQYQLWIIDSRGMTQRISGGVFNGGAGETGELVVPITPAIPVKSAAAFAVTIEEPGGTWVSDMKRRVVIAAKKS